MSLHAGQTVRHGKFGVGQVRTAGDPLRVSFASIGGDRWVPSSELEPVAGDTAPAPASALVPPPIRKVHRHSRDARLQVECLRQGLPPPDKILSWTVGFEDERRRLDQALSRASREGRGTTFVIEADYGRGKSHFGRIAHNLALEQQLMTMHADLSAVSVREGSSLLVQLLSSILLPSFVYAKEDDAALRHVSGVGSLLQLFARRFMGKVPDGLSVFEPFLRFSTAWRDNEDAIEVIERYLAGDGSKLEHQRNLQELLESGPLKLESLGINNRALGVEGLIDAQVDQLKRIVELAVHTGSKGALLVLDELDHEFADAIPLRQRQRSLQFLETLSQRAQGLPLVVVLLATPQPDLPLSRIGTPITLPFLTEEQLQRITTMAILAYEQAFPAATLPEPSALFSALVKVFRERFEKEGWGARFFVRATIEACDWHAAGRVNPYRAGPA